jgi:galactoside O-acetyltransferase
MAMHNAAYLSRESLERLGFAGLGDDVLIHPTCVLVGCERMRIGSHVRLDPFCVVTMSADLVIGDRVHVSAHASLLGGGGIVIGDFACVSHGARVLSSSGDFSGGRICGPMVPPHHRHVVTARIEIGRHAVLGANSVILPGGGIGEGATVGALSLVKTPLEPWTVNAGVPTRVVGRRDRAGVLAQERLLADERR